MADWCSVQDYMGGVHASVTAWKNFLGIHRSYGVVYMEGRHNGLTASQVGFIVGSSSYLETERLAELMLALASSPVAPVNEWCGWYGDNVLADVVSQVVSEVAPRMENWEV